MNTTAFDPADYLDTPEAQEELLVDAAASGDARYIAVALGTIARARGMTKVAKDAGMTGEPLYRALSEDGDPAPFDVAWRRQALGLRITFSDAA